MKQVSKSLNQWLSGFLKSPCPLCQRFADREFCLDCQRQLENCRLSASGQQWSGELPWFAWGQYQGSLKRAIATLKYESKSIQIARPLGFWLGEAWLKSGHHRPRLTVVPIPLAPEKLQKRGFNQAELLAQGFCHYTHLPLQSQGLIRVKETEALHSLNPSQRQETLKGALQVGPAFLRRPPKHPVLILDDIYTTGSTAKAAAEALCNKGIAVYGVVAIAKTPFQSKTQR